ncbi:polycystin-1 isoform X2 [Aplysia californica]|uniref:Polycystin-1 isoform X2 n=1 Tax=Aplysia californica TaxID=6500 RepID=A0ABM1W102_APLCA|nr:polycystin-1 isoform X2 [Aplysia californica]
MFYVFFTVLMLCASAQDELATEGETAPGALGGLLFTCPQGDSGSLCTCTATEVDCSSVGLSTLPNDLGSGVQRLILRNNALSSIDIISSQSMPALLYIDASYNSISSLDWSSFSLLTSLEEINISGNQLLSLSEGSQELPVEQLYIENCGLSYFSFGASVTFCNLKILHVGGNSLTTLPDDALSCMADLEEIKLNNCDLTSLSANTFSSNALIQYIDLSSNRLTSLPSGLFDGLDNLKEINLSGNDWSCDCSLIWLRIFLDSFVAAGGTIVDEDQTLCSRDPSNPLRMTRISAFQICPRKAGSCVYDFASESYKLIQYSSWVSFATSTPECRDLCYLSGYSYSVFDPDVAECLCGSVVSLPAGCSDCGGSTSSLGPGLCSNEYSNILGAVGMMYDFSITYSPTSPNVFEKVYFMWSGGPLGINGSEWDFGDSTTTSVLSTSTTSHTFTYPGQRQVTLTLHIARGTALQETMVSVPVEVGSRSDLGILNCPLSDVSTYIPQNVSATFTSAWRQKVSWTREAQTTSNSQYSYSYNYSRCEPGWQTFRGRCIQMQSSPTVMSAAHTACLAKGAKLLRLHSMDEIDALRSNNSLFPSGAGASYFTGAEWKASQERYEWRFSSTNAFVFRDTLTSASAGDCVVIQASGLSGEDCGVSLPYICEKEPSSCVQNGQPNSKLCYAVSSESLSRPLAAISCQSNYTNGQLVTIADINDNSYLKFLLSKASVDTVWIGLEASFSENIYTWDSGQPLTLYSNWDSGFGAEPCVVMNASTGLWQKDLCDSSHHFICEYFVGDEINIPTLVAGTVPLMLKDAIPVSVSESTTVNTVSSSVITIIPGSWIADQGYASLWIVQTESVASETQIFLQIWRPTCTYGILHRPGCSSQSPLYTCVSSQGSPCSSSTCPQGQYFCLLTRTCLTTGQPCTCAGLDPTTITADCQALSLDASTSKFTLIHSWAVTIPAHTTLISFSPPPFEEVQIGDVLGFQSEQDGFVSCQAPSTSVWSQAVFRTGRTAWASLGDTVDPHTQSVLVADSVCGVSLSYVTQSQQSSSDILGYLTEPGEYAFTLDFLDLSSSTINSQTCTVTALDSVDGLLWVGPDISGTNSMLLGSSTESLNISISVEAGTPQDLTIKVLRGSDLEISWTVHGTVSSGTFSSSCPVSLASSNSFCQDGSSFLSDPFSSLSSTFRSLSQTGSTSVMAQVSNTVSSKTLFVEVQAYLRITGLEFYHDNCQNRSNCEVRVEIGVAQICRTTFTAGDYVTVAYTENGVAITSTQPDQLVISRTFLQAGTYVLQVTATNILGNETADLTVHAFIKANFQYLIFTTTLPRAEVNVPQTINAEAKLTKDAYYKAVWSFGSETFSFPLVAAKGEIIRPSAPKTFNATGNITVSLVLEDVFGNSLSQSFEVEVYKRINSVQLTPSTSYPSTTSPFILLIQINNSTAGDTTHFGVMNFTLDLGDGSPIMSWISMSPVLEKECEITTEGVFTITLTVFSDLIPGNVLTTTASVKTEDGIAGLKLTYDGPKHVSESITFFANHSAGSDMTYLIQFGDSYNQTSTSPSFTYQYAAAGVYEAILYASNAVSSLTARLRLYAYDEDLLQILELNSKTYVEANKSVTVRTDVAAESPQALDYNWSFGNGETVNGTGRDSASTVFSQIGLYTITLTVSNVTKGTSDVKSKDVFVEQKIEDLNVTYNNPVSLPSPTSTVFAVFTATIGSGSNLSYTWQVDSTKDVSTENVLNFTVPSAGIYSVKIKVSNDLNRIVKRMEFVAMEIITGLSINCITCSLDVYAATGVRMAFEASLVYGSHENYTWSFTGLPILLLGSSASFIYSTPGTYSVTLVSQNNVSNSAVTADITAQDVVGSVTISQTSSPVKINDVVTLSASVSSGTNVALSWMCGSSNIGTTSTIVHSFNSSGYHTCTVNASNYVSYVIKSHDVPILDEISSVAVNHSLVGGSSSVYYAALNKWYDFFAVSNTAFLVDYEWKVMRSGLSLRTGRGQKFSYSFSVTAQYELQLKASNDISSQETSITLELMEEIRSVSLRSDKQSPLLAGIDITFFVISFAGSNLDFEWHINGTLINSGSNQYLGYRFTNAGQSSVQVKVSNMLGSVTKEIVMTTLNPVSNTTIYFGQHGVFWHSPFIAEGTSVNVSCAYLTGSDVEFEWTVKQLATGRTITFDTPVVPFTFMEIGFYEITVNASNLLSYEEGALTVEVQGAVTDLMINLDHQLVATGSSISFASVLNPEATNVSYVWSVAGETLSALSFSRQMSAAGVYVVFLTAQNNVSSVTKQEVIRVQDIITNLQFSDCSLIREANTSVSLTAVVGTGTNVTFWWEIEVGNQNISLKGKMIDFLFPEEGIYNVYLGAENEVSTDNFTCTVELHLPIGSSVTLEISEPRTDYIFQNQDVTFMVDNGNLDFATFQWNVTGEPGYVSSSSPYTRSFSNIGNYTLFLTIFNGISKAELSIEFNVKVFLCQLPDVTRVGDASRSVQRSRSLELEVAINPNGCTEYLAVHSWSVYSPTCSGHANQTEMVDLGATSVTSPHLIIQARQLEVGSYCVSFATGYHYTSVLETVDYMVNVTAAPIKAVIKGGDGRTMAAGSNLCFDGSLSYDPNELQGSRPSLQYEWKCEAVSAFGGSCFPTSTASQVCFTGFGIGKYNISLTVTAPNRVAGNTEQNIQVIQTTSFMPIASIVCESCATLENYRVSASQHVALSATCENCQCQPSFSWTVYDGLNQLPLDSSQTSTGLTSQSLVLRRWGALSDGVDYTFMVYVECQNVSSNQATASLLLPANLPPSGGYCTISPTRILPLEEQVTVSCHNWIDIDDLDSPILYKIYAEVYDPLSGTNQSYPLYAGTDPTQSAYLGSFSNETVVLKVMVSDEFGAMALGAQSTIQMQTPHFASSMTKTDYLVNITDTVLSGLIKQASPISLLQFAIAMGQELNAESHKEKLAQTAGSGSLPEQQRASIRDVISICLSTSVPVSSLEDVHQMAFALRLITDYSSEYLTEDSQVLIAGTMETMASVLQQSVNNGLDLDDVPTEDLLSVINNLINAANTRVYSSSVIWGGGRNVTVKSFDTEFRDLRPEISSSVGHLDFEDISLGESHRKRMISTLVPLLEGVVVSTLKTMIPQEESLNVGIEEMMVIGSRIYARDISLRGLGDSTQISIPSTILKGHKNDTEEVFQVMISHEQNPFTFSYLDEESSSMPVQTLSFYDIDGTYIEVSGLSGSSQVYMYMFSTPTPGLAAIPRGDLPQSSIYQPLNGLTYNTVQINPRRTKMFQVPGAESITSTGVGIHVQLRIEYLPSSGPAPSNRSGTNVMAYIGVNFVPSSGSYTKMLNLTSDLMSAGTEHTEYTFFLNGLSSSDSVYVIATNMDLFVSVNMSVGVYTSTCSYFDTTDQLWSNEGCTAQEESIATVTACQCNHLTSFGGAGIVSITDIDFTDIVYLDFFANPVVFVAVGVIFILYVIVAIICRYLDRLDLRRISRIPLCGRDGAFKYEITVVTGRHYGSGTTANIGIKLYGDQNKGEARHLTKPGAFQRNCRDTFYIAHDASIGEVNKVLVWHDNGGLSPSWFLSHIVVKDVQTGEKFTFLVNSWLSLEMKDGVVQKTVKSADKEELRKFRLKFSTVFHGTMSDVHAWLSVSHRPDLSRFTRVQRATCVFTTVLLYMCINAMWYGLFKDETEAKDDLSWDSFGWEEVIIAIISTLMVLPFLIGLSFAFKKTRCKDSVFQEVRPSTAQTLEIEAMCDLSGDGGSYRTVTPLGEWVTAIDRESTTDSFAVPVGLRRTVPMHRGLRKGSSDISIRERPPVEGVGGKKELWTTDSIMQSWPHRMPTWIKQVKAEVKSGDTSTMSRPSIERGSTTTSKRSSRSARTFQSGTRSYEDSDEDFQKKLDEIDAELTRSEERKQKKRKKLERRLRSRNTDELFDSDDDWVYEGLEDYNEDSFSSKPSQFNPRTEAELAPGPERNGSGTSAAHQNGSLRVAESPSSRRKEQPTGWRDGHRPSVISSTSKSRSTLSDNKGRGRTLSTISQQPEPSESNPRFSLPPWCVYVTYTVCVVLCVLSVILMLLYGYNFGTAISLKWLVSLFISVFLSILIIEPLKVLLISVIVALITKDVRDDDEGDVINIKPSVESNEQLKDIKFRPLGGFALLQAKEEGKRKQRLHKMLREVFMFTLMLALFMAIVFVNYSSRTMYHASNNIETKFYTSVDGSTNGLNFTNMRSITDFWQWSETVLARSLHLQDLSSDESFGYLLGPAWMRQIRSKNVSCTAASSIAMWSVPTLTPDRCTDDGTSDPDTADYNIGWVSPGIAGANWTYSSCGQLDLYSKFGWSLFYPGGGYVQTLGQTYNDTLATVQKLHSEGWLDLLTRAVMVEFSLYYPSADLTSYITLIIEFPISGGVLTSYSIYTEKFLRFIPGVVEPLLVCQVFFSLFVLYLTLVLLQRLRAEKLKFFSYFWNWMDSITCFLAWLSLALYAGCVALATKRMDAYFADTSRPSRLGQIVKQVQFSRPLFKFYTTLSTASGPLLGVFIIFVILLLTHAQFGYLIYGSLIYGYHSFQHSMTSLFGIMGSRTDFWPLFESQRILTHFFFLCFGFFVYGLTMALSVSVLMWSYKWSSSQMSYKTTLEARDYEMIDFMIKQFKLMTGIQKQKPAFRHVKFKGLPSLPSRGTSSNLSSRQSCNSVSSRVSVPARPEVTEDQHVDYLMASLLPTWDQVLQSFQKLEDLDKDVDEATKKLQDAVKGWGQPHKSVPSDHVRFQSDNSKPIMGKPPLDPKATFAKFRGRGAGRNITVFAGRAAMTPPTTFMAETPLGSHSKRPFSDQGFRKDPFVFHTDNSAIPIPIGRPVSQTSAAPSSTSSSQQRGSPGPGFYSNDNSISEMYPEVHVYKGKGRGKHSKVSQGINLTPGGAGRGKQAWDSEI